MIDFTTLQGLTIPEGVVTQITDASGRVLWMLDKGTRAVLQVAKQTLDTLAGETTYTGESFVAIDVYPKTNGKVKVTYGGLTKTITDASGAENPNAQTVYFGTLYGVADGVETPASGEVVIEGNFVAFGAGLYYSKGSKGKTANYCPCITTVIEWGDVTLIPYKAFSSCVSLTSITIPDGVTSIGDYAFSNCSSLTSITIPDSVTSIGSYAFYNCAALTDVTIGNGVTSIAERTFYGCSNLANVTLSNNLTSIGSYAFYMCRALTRITLPNTLQRLENNAFNGCKQLDYVVVPASVTFLGFSSLSCHTNSNGVPDGNYYIRSTAPPEMEVYTSGSYTYRAFGTGVIGSITIWVPKGYGETYKNADGWSYYANRIVEET